MFVRLLLNTSVRLNRGSVHLLAGYRRRERGREGGDRGWCSFTFRQQQFKEAFVRQMGCVLLIERRWGLLMSVVHWFSVRNKHVHGEKRRIDRLLTLSGRQGNIGCVRWKIGKGSSQQQNVSYEQLGFYWLHLTTAAAAPLFRWNTVTDPKFSL